MKEKKMAKFVLLQGLPASGKTTLARQLLADYGNAVRLNRNRTKSSGMP